MSRWRMGVALTAAWLALEVAARAQYPAPPQAGTRLMPEPMPYSPAPSAAAPSGTPFGFPPGGMPGAPGGMPGAPGGMPGAPGGMPGAPGGPGCPPDLTLSADHTGAFECNPPEPECAFIISAGAIALQRQGLGTGAIAVANPSPFFNGMNIPPESPKALGYDNIQQKYNWGFQGTLGYIVGNQALEATGFFLPTSTTGAAIASPTHSLDALFGNPPPGFSGTHGLFQLADVVSTSFSSTLANAELNYRYWPAGYAGLDMILGVRYIDQKEALQIGVQEDGLTMAAPLATAVYTAFAHNHIVAPQVGAEYTLAPCRWFAVSLVAKGAFGPNFVNTYTSLARGDGYQGFNGHRDVTVFSQVYSGMVSLDFAPTDRMRFRVGYNLLWLVGIATAGDTTDYNLQHTYGSGNTDGSTFYQGPSAEFQLLF